MYEDLVELIKRKRIAFPPFGHGVSDATIDSAEAELGTAFPPSYRWWLRNYGGGQIDGDIVYGLDEEGVGVPDIVRLHEANMAEGLLPPHELVFYVGNEETFHFDTRQPLESGEYRIYYREAGQPDTEYARTFEEFLLKRITEVMS